MQNLKEIKKQLQQRLKIIQYNLIIINREIEIENKCKKKFENENYPKRR